MSFRPDALTNASLNAHLDAKNSAYIYKFYFCSISKISKGFKAFCKNLFLLLLYNIFNILEFLAISIPIPKIFRLI